MVCSLLRQPETHLVTLTGPPGVGKTRLALGVAITAAAAFSDGIWWVDLAPVRDPNLVLQRIAQSLAPRRTPSESLEERLRDALRGRKLLLVVDGFEHVLAAAPRMAKLLADLPGLTMLVTSRESLRLRWEREYLVAPLPVPDLSGHLRPAVLREQPAVALFVQRARAVDIDFDLTPENARHVAEICVRLEGLPLALELAAARIKTLPPEVMQARLGRRLDVLRVGPRDQPQHHGSLRDAIRWSYDLLSPVEQRLFRRVAVFVGGFGLHSAAAVAGPKTPPQDLLDGLGALVDKNLITRDRSEGQEPRFHMLDTLREFGREVLGARGEADRVRETHAVYFRRMAEEAEQQLRGPDQERWLNLLEREHDNILAALAWLGTEERAEERLRLVGGLARFWVSRGHTAEARREVTAALQASVTHRTPGRAKTMLAAGLLAYHQSEYAAATSWYEESVMLYRELGDEIGTANALNALGVMARNVGNLAQAASHLERSLEIFTRLGDQRGMGLVLGNLGIVARHRGDLAGAQACFEDSLAALRAIGDTQAIGAALCNVGNVARDRGDYQTAADRFKECLATSQTRGDEGSIAHAMAQWGLVEMQRGAFDIADRLLKDSLRIRTTLDGSPGLPYSVEYLGRLAGLRGQTHRAGRLLGAAEALRESLSDPLPPADRADYERALERLREKLPLDRLMRAWQIGRALSTDAAIAYALGNGRTAQSPGERGVPGDPGSVLTRRERDVAVLVARGITNREIARTLGISERTAANHVQRILDKLGFRSRAQIAVWIAQADGTLPR